MNQGPLFRYTNEMSKPSVRASERIETYHCSPLKESIKGGTACETVSLTVVLAMGYAGGIAGESLIGICVGVSPKISVTTGWSTSSKSSLSISTCTEVGVACSSSTVGCTDVDGTTSSLLHWEGWVIVGTSGGCTEVDGTTSSPSPSVGTYSPSPSTGTSSPSPLGGTYSPCPLDGTSSPSPSGETSSPSLLEVWMIQPRDGEP